MGFNLFGNSATLADVLRERRADALAIAQLEKYAFLPHLTKQTVAAATATVQRNCGVCLVSYTATGAVTLTLGAAEHMKERTLIVKDSGGNAGVNNITIDAAGSETIDGSSTYVINANYEAVQLYCDGAAWYVINGYKE